MGVVEILYARTAAPLCLNSFALTSAHQLDISVCQIMVNQNHNLFRAATVH